MFKDIVDYLNKDDLMVLNNTKVLSCRLIGSRLTGGRLEVLLFKHKQGLTFSALIKPSRIKLGEKIIFNTGKLSGIVTAFDQITFDARNIDEVYNQGLMPLPPYIKRNPEDLDNIYYQTVYAQKRGSIASPTAGLHFTKELIKKIESNGVKVGYITLHVGLATFRPVKTENILKHKMEPEYFKIPDGTIRLIEKARKDKARPVRKSSISNRARIFAVGTTSLRALETYWLGMKEGDTDLFIYPGYKFNIVDCLLTNFHLPRTTLFMLVCAFAGTKLIKNAYAEAIDKRYRFYSYGDAMLIV